MEKYEKRSEGAFGKVYKAIEKETGKLVALKKSKLEMDKDVPSTTLREIDLLNRLSHSIYIVRLLSVEHVSHSPNPSISLFFEYLDTDLKKFIDSYKKSTDPRPLEPRLVQSLMFQLCKGVTHCHSHSVLHRDLKPHNLLLAKEKGVLKIADFGLSRSYDIPLQAYSHDIGTLWYIAPEVLLGSTHYSTAVDMWSVGCIFAEMIRMRALFRGNCEFQQLLQIFRLLGTPTEQQWPGVTSLPDWEFYPEWEPQDLSSAVPTLSPEGVDLLTKMLRCNPGDTIDAKTALDHPYFASLDKSQF